MNKDDVLKKLNKHFPLLKEKYPIKEMGVFGSVMRGEDGEGSDIDILVDFYLPVGFFDFIRLENDLSKILGRKVDLLSKKAIKRAVREAILKETVYV